MSNEIPKGRPIRPGEVALLSQQVIPPEVFDAFNELIAKGWDGVSATVVQGDAVVLACKNLGIVREAFDSKWLNVESAYARHGWKVVYDKPGYNESYPATFTFKRAKG